ncbi:hypothetical protein [Pseudokineococcus sp. 1T1Z-3]|uniref:hypothetical protein n=1 Tax=Pseudokineococcus sp. 1T1Z-3 TaxID=3132745 RepID=UPI0030AF35A8
MDAAPPLHEGTELSGRYRLVRRTGGSAPAGGPAPVGATSTWHGRDLLLRRPVELLAVAGGAEDVVDAARRAALVEDPRVLRVLDVGSTGTGGHGGSTRAPGSSREGASEEPEAGWSFVVTESVPGESLAALVRRRGPLPAPLVRTLVGEAAQALERARALGLHHRRLSPAHLLRASDGGVVVTGVEIRAAVADGDPAEAVAGDVDPAVAARADVVGLVALVHAGLTGCWPGPLRGDAAGAGRPVDGSGDAEGAGLPSAPRGDGGPVAPADLVDDVPADLDLLCSAVLGPHEDGPRTPGELAEQLAPWDSPYLDGRPGGGGGTAASPHLRTHDGEPDEAVAAPASLVPAARRPRSSPSGATGSLPPVDGGEGERLDDVTGPETGTAAAKVPAVVGTTSAATTASVAGAAVPGAGGRRAAAGVGLGGRTGSARLSGGAAGDGGAPARAGGGSGPAVTGGSGGLGDEGSAGAGEGAMAAEVARRPSRTQSAVVIGVALAAVVLALLLALQVLRGIGPGGDDDVAGPAPTETGQAQTTDEPAPEPEPEPEPPPAPVVTNGVVADPLGDGVENDELVPLALDGDPGTAWRSSTYTTADFGNLKEGVGYGLQLEAPVLVSGVTLTTPTAGGTVELRTAPGFRLEGSQVVATAELGGGPVDLVPPEPVEAQELLLWFTSLPPYGGGYAVEVSQVQVR